MVQRQATFLPVSYLSTEGSNPFARILRTSIFFLRAAIPKWCPLLRMRRGAGCWQPKRRLPPAATSNGLPGTQLAECSTFDGSIIQRENRNTIWPIHILCVYFIHHPIRTWRISYFNLTCMLLSLQCLFLSGSPKRAHFHRRNFLTLDRNSEPFVLIRLFLSRGPVLCEGISIN